MLNSATLDVVVGLALVFLTVSVIVSAINETLSTILALRAKGLQEALDSLLGPALAEAVVNHPSIPATGSNGTKLPSYIEPAYFAVALLDEVANKAQPPPTVVVSPEIPPTPATATTPAIPGTPAKTELAPAIDHFRAALNDPALAAVASTSVRQALAAFEKHSGGDYATLQAQVAGWFDAYMDRFAGVYKRRSHVFAIIIAVFVVGILNVDTIKVYKQLSSQPAYAAALAAKADAVVKKAQTDFGHVNTGGALDQQVSQINAEIAAIPVPLGWHSDDLTDPWSKIVGLLLTAIAASLGAPFWFDALNKLANMRGSGTKPDPTPPPTPVKS